MRNLTDGLAKVDAQSVTHLGSGSGMGSGCRAP
jgi:hypothetical protein